MAFLSLDSVSFSYKNTPVIKDFSLQVEEGSFTTLLGASGCGKTTLLRIISGFLDPQSGTVSIDGKVVNGVLPNRRKVGMVFQDYALFPHMTVEQNLLYGLNIKHQTKQQKAENASLVLQTAESLGISELLHRFPSELSGGQQQRVALGRALMLKPNLLLMDEPLSSLDAKLRFKVREELKEIQKKLKITTVYVTHDQEEALCLSDKIAIINQSSLVQYGTPEQIYFEPANHFVADFVGRANFINEGVGGIVKESMIRPEWISLSKNAAAMCTAKGTVLSKEFLGPVTRYEVRIDGSEEISEQVLICDQPTVSGEMILPGDRVGVSFARRWML